MNEDGFQDLAPSPKGPPKVADVVISVYSMGTSRKLNLSLKPGMLGSAARCSIAYNPQTFTLRITPDDERGRFEVGTPPGRQGRLLSECRQLLRLDLPVGVLPAKAREPGPYQMKAGALFVVIPPPLRVPAPKVDAVAAARAAFPASAAKL